MRTQSDIPPPKLGLCGLRATRTRRPVSEPGGSPACGLFRSQPENSMTRMRSFVKLLLLLLARGLALDASAVRVKGRQQRNQHGTGMTPAEACMILGLEGAACTKEAANRSRKKLLIQNHADRVRASIGRTSVALPLRRGQRHRSGGAVVFGR